MYLFFLPCFKAPHPYLHLQVPWALFAKPYEQAGHLLYLLSWECLSGTWTWILGADFLPQHLLCCHLCNLWNKKRKPYWKCSSSFPFNSHPGSRFLNSYCHLVDKDVFTATYRPHTEKILNLSRLVPPVTPFHLNRLQGASFPMKALDLENYRYSILFEQRDVFRHYHFMSIAFLGT